MLLHGFIEPDARRLKVGQLQHQWKEGKWRADIYYTYSYFRFQCYASSGNRALRMPFKTDKKINNLNILTMLLIPHYPT